MHCRHPTGVYVVSKLTALGLVLLSVLVLGIFTSITIQLLSGYDALEVSLYLHRGFGAHAAAVPIGGGFVCLRTGALNNRFVGMMIMVLYLISPIVLQALGFEHPLYRFASDIDTPCRT